MTNLIVYLIILFFTIKVPATLVSPLTAPTQSVLAQREMSLDDRAQSPYINEVFRKNILLNLAYLDGSIHSKNEIDWEAIEQPKSTAVTLQPQQVFAYHDDLLAEYQSKEVVTTQAHFNAQEGFVSSGWLYGDGVCHLASLINWAAQDAGLEVEVTKPHNIASIPNIPKQYGVSIYIVAGQKGSGARNNLYITNNQNYPVTFQFAYDENHHLTVSVLSAKLSS